jgi:hypothetical protein
VKVKGHAAEVLEAARALEAETRWPAAQMADFR